MIATEPRIQVPQWSARFGRPQADAPRPQQGRVVGPLTVFDAEAGVDVATFGSPSRPGVVLFDGYLFERRALRRELGLAASACDATIAAAAFERWGDDVFDRLDGSYLLAIWDPAAERLLLGHDALGHHPVFYAPSADGVWFGSNVLTLAAASGLSSRINRVSIALIALTQWPAAGDTCFEGIHRLRPGRFLSLRNGQRHEHRYFSPWLADGEPDLTERQVHEGFEAALVGAVNRCMDLDPEGIMLSGGLDSVTIAALAAEHSAHAHTPLITAVSGRRDHQVASEEAAQTATAQALKMRHLVARESEWMGDRGEVELSLDIVGELPAPSRVYWVGAYMGFYRHTAAQGVRVLLTGSGGDNWVAVGNAYAAECMRQLRLGDLLRFVRSYTTTGGLSYSAAAQYLLWSGGARMLLDAAGACVVPGLKAKYHRGRAHQALPEWIAPDRSLREALADTLFAQRPPSLTETGRVPASFYRHEQRAVVNPYYQYEFELGFHIESACGLRLLSPYHDRQLVRFLNAVPPQVLLAGGSYKGLLRTVAERRLPNLGLGEQRKDHTPEVLSAQRMSLRQGVLHFWPGEKFQLLSEMGVVDRQALARAPLAGTRVATELVKMYALMSAERWVAARSSAR